KKETLTVTVKSLPGSDEVAAKDTDNNADNGTLNGVGVSDLTAEAREQFNIPKKVSGAVVTEVDPSSASADAGLKAGDVIQEINHHPVRTADDAVKLTTDTKDKHTLLRIWSNGGSHYLVVDESKAE
ncbi:MAG TPA: PDZ domain-containing protein, partial [Verrucomicrobiae bacterium]